MGGRPRGKARTGLLALGTLAAGAVVGAAVEEVVYRRLLGARDRAGAERFGSVRGEVVEATSFDGTRLHCRVHGPADAPAIVFLHGFTLSSDIWHYQVRELAAEGRYRVVVYDARGHGRSGPARGPDGQTAFTPDTLGRDLWAVLEAATAGRALVVGHSMGGMTVQALASFGEDFPVEMGGVVRGLVLLNTTFTASLGLWRAGAPRLQGLRKAALASWELLARHPRRIDRVRLPASDLAMLAARLGFGRGASPAHVALTMKLMSATPTDTLVAAVGGLAEFESIENLAAIDVPTLVVAGDRDLVTPVWLAREMSERIPDAQLVVLEGAGHMGMLERPDELTDLIRTFADKVLQ
ncbi:MAG TPA: alpha/beta fold hydrolase [Actinomycetota bacterium]|nr:alpha/beta fold hydrolase [Actinomycetota bacterium]